MLHQFSKLALEDGMMVRKMKTRTQIVLPEEFHPLVYQELHTKMGHLGPERVEELSRQRFYWPYMKADIEHFIQHKCSCVASKQPPKPEIAPLVPVVASAPFELLCVDFLHLDRCQGYEYVLLVTDYFTHFSQAYAARNNKSLTAAKLLFKEFIPQFGFPQRVHSDRGQEFCSELFQELHRLSGIRMSATTPYHPMGNGAVERLNRTLINMLRSIPEDQKKRWKEHLGSLMFAYNSTVHKSTGYSPFYLLFGRESRLPIDTIMPVEPQKTTRKTYDKFVRDWKDSLRDAYQIAHQHQITAAAANKKRYDRKMRHVAIDVGDKVLVRNLTPRGGTGKMNSWWERRIYTVISIRDLVPVYTIKPIDGGKPRTVHRNLLMKVDDLPDDIFDQEKPGKKPVQQGKPQQVPEPVPQVSSDSDSTDFVVRRNPVRRQYRLGRSAGPSPLLNPTPLLMEFSNDSLDDIPTGRAADPQDIHVEEDRAQVNFSEDSLDEALENQENALEPENNDSQEEDSDQGGGENRDISEPEEEGDHGEREEHAEHSDHGEHEVRNANEEESDPENRNVNDAENDPREIEDQDISEAGSEIEVLENNESLSDQEEIEGLDEEVIEANDPVNSGSDHLEHITSDRDEVQVSSGEPNKNQEGGAEAEYSEASSIEEEAANEAFLESDPEQVDLREMEPDGWVEETGDEDISFEQGDGMYDADIESDVEVDHQEEGPGGVDQGQGMADVVDDVQVAKCPHNNDLQE